MRPVSELKTIAKRRISGNYGCLISAFLLSMLIVFTLNIVESVILLLSLDLRNVSSLNGLIGAFQAPSVLLKAYGISLIISLLSKLIFTGFRYVSLLVARGQKPELMNLFFPFLYNPDKILIIAFLVWVLSNAVHIVSLMGFGGGGVSSGGVNGGVFFMEMLLQVVMIVVIVLVNSYMFASYYIYLDEPDKALGDIIRESISLMRGNVLRLIYLTLTFAGWMLLVLFTYGIAAVYVVPYMYTVYGLFYRDLKGEAGNGYYSEA